MSNSAFCRDCGNQIHSSDPICPSCGVRQIAQQYVGFWARSAATIVDTLIVLLVTFPLLFMVYGSEYLALVEETFVAGPADLVITYILPFIAVILFWKHKQATPGKMMFSAKIVDAETGLPVSTARLIGRYLGYFISALPLGLGYFWVAFDSRKQSWHDKLAGTVVVRK